MPRFTGRLLLRAASLGCLALLSAGCLAPPILFPRTGAHGIVVDQYGAPIPNARMEADWIPVQMFYIFPPNSPGKQFAADKTGHWKFCRRKVDTLFIGVLPLEGYERQDDTYQIHLYNGQCPTNDVVLRLHKIEPARPSKETK